MFQFPQPLYGLTDRNLAKNQDLITQVRAMLDGGLKLIQYREKEVSDDAFTKEAQVIQQIIRELEGRFIINDRVSVALKIGADGIHIGQHDYPLFGETPVQALKNIRTNYRQRWHEDLIIGLSVSSYAEAQVAVSAGADYLGIGAIHQTPSKPDAVVIPTHDLEKIMTEIKIPKVAIGGINASNYPLLLKMEFESVSMLRGLLDPDQVGGGDYETVKRQVERFLDITAPRNSYEFWVSSF